MHLPLGLKLTTETEEKKLTMSSAAKKRPADKFDWKSYVRTATTSQWSLERTGQGGGRSIHKLCSFTRKHAWADKIRQQLLAMPMPSLGDKSVISKRRSMQLRLAACLFLDITARERCGEKKGTGWSSYHAKLDGAIMAPEGYTGPVRKCESNRTHMLPGNCADWDASHNIMRLINP